MSSTPSLPELIKQASASMAHMRASNPGLQTPMLAHGIDTFDQLAKVLRAFYAELLAQDQKEGNSDRDSGTFQFYGSGLAGVLELEAGAGSPIEP